MVSVSATRLTQLVRRIFLGAAALSWFFFGVKTGSATPSITFGGEITSFSCSLPGPSFSAGQDLTGSAFFGDSSVPIPTFAGFVITVGGFQFGGADDGSSSSINSTGFALNLVTPLGYSPFQDHTFVYITLLSGSFVTGTGAFSVSGLDNTLGDNASFSLSGNITGLEAVPDAGSTAQLLCLSASLVFVAQRLRFRQTKM
jgi:hypothetical protein